MIRLIDANVELIAGVDSDADFDLEQSESRLGSDMADASEAMARACTSLTAAHNTLHSAQEFVGASKISLAHQQCVRGQQEIARAVRTLRANGQLAFRFRSQQIYAR